MSISFPTAFIESMGGGEMLMVLLLVVLLFGARRLPGLARGLGTAVREFRKSVRDDDGAGEFASSAREVRFSGESDSPKKVGVEKVH